MGNRVRRWLAVGMCGAMLSAMLLAGTGVVSAEGTNDNDSSAQVAQQDGSDVGAVQADPSGDTASDGATSDAP